MRKALALAAALALLSPSPASAAGFSQPTVKNTIAFSANLGAAVGGWYLAAAGAALGGPGTALVIVGALVATRGLYGTYAAYMNLRYDQDAPTSFLERLAIHYFPGRAGVRDLAVGIDVAFDVALIWLVPSVGLVGNSWHVWPLGRFWASALARVSKNAYEFGKVSTGVGLAATAIGAADLTGHIWRAALRPRAPARSQASAPLPTAERAAIPSGQAYSPPAQAAVALPSAPTATAQPYTAPAQAYIPPARAAVPSATATPAPAPEPMVLGPGCPAGYRHDRDDGQCYPKETFEPTTPASPPTSAPEPTTWGPGVDVRSR